MNPNERQLLLATISKIKNIAKKRFNNDVYNNVYDIFNLLEKNEQVIILQEFTIICFIVDDEVISESKENIILEGADMNNNTDKVNKEEIEMKEQAALKFWLFKVFCIISFLVIVFLAMLGVFDPVEFFSKLPSNASDISEILKVIVGLK